MQLADLTTLRLGGPARHVVEATTTDELVDTVRRADVAGDPVLVVGGGSNLVVGDAGWPGTVVLVRTAEQRVEQDGDAVTVVADAGVVWDDLVADSVARGWSGLAAMSGIPGSTGATPVQNVGAYGSEVADAVTGLRVLDRGTGTVEDWDPVRCGFGFRTSAFKHTDRYVVLSVTFGLTVSPDAPPIRYLELARRLGVEQGGRAPSTAVRETVLALRRSKGMVLDAPDHDTWSVGSFFVNPFVPADRVPAGCPNWEVDGAVKLSAAWLIENAGYGRGFAAGSERVSVSTKHTLALTNRGDATTAELVELARVIRDGVDRRFGVRLRPEAHLVGVEL
ncbi:UDP-N-acetylmuramate dehydrogenase [Jatrophihabitans endophyticus]|uniref:UDP-N-acetylenolpyruvoylglucosamine reductase n=1 Tax=Jatrophihabitans endophyticus TaxID=1206085 RepID=A0A1M5QVZ4_9ACTN|nr:UDP-N-acetylmuramate dehydrogenase [Jatrophihabitans endophyticus]